MNFDDTGSLLSSLLISCIGMGYFMYGKKAARLIPLVAGLLLGIYPYFITDLWLMWGIAVAIVAATYFLRGQ